MRWFLRLSGSILVACSVCFFAISIAQWRSKILLLEEEVVLNRNRNLLLEEKYGRLFQELQIAKEIAKMDMDASKRHERSQESLSDLTRGMTPTTEKSWPELRALQADDQAPSRELGYVSFFDYTSAQSNSGCLIYNLSADVTVAVSSPTSCNGKRCPPCFALDMAGGPSTYVHTLTLSGCSSINSFSNHLQKLMLINLHRTSSAIVSDGSSYYSIVAGEHVIGSCSSISGDTMHMPKALRIYPKAGSTWREQTSAAPWDARCDHDMVVRPDGVLLVLGGWNGLPYGTYRTNDVWSSSDGGSNWNLLTDDAAWSKRSGHRALVRNDGAVLVLGGSNGSYVNDVYVSNDGGLTWKELTNAAAWSGRKSFGANVLLDGTVLVLGGWNNAHLNDVWASYDGGAAWQQKTASAAWTARSGLGSVVRLDGTVLVLGGSDSVGDKNDVYASSDGGSTWSSLTSAASWSARHTHKSVVVQLDGSIVVMGGGIGTYDGITAAVGRESWTSAANAASDVWRSSDGGANWQRLTSNAAWGIRFAHATVVRLDGSLVLAGGAAGNVRKEVYISES